MKLGIIGLPTAGKKTVFEALSGNPIDPGQLGEDQLATVTVPDPRVQQLREMYQPQKTTFAQVVYLLPGRGGSHDSSKESTPWQHVRDCDALVHVVRDFKLYGMQAPDPARDFATLDQELMLTDLVSVEKRLERLAGEKQRGTKSNPEEKRLLLRAHAALETETPLRRIPDITASPLMRGFAFLSAKPQLVLLNSPDETAIDAPVPAPLSDVETCMRIRGQIEQELAQMSAAEAAEFLSEFDISAAAADRVVRCSLDLLGLISFFTVGGDEVKAWTVARNTDAQNAAGAVHSDMAKGFIRAEVLAYDDLISAGSTAEARKQGTLRVEGKTYIVQDGDILNIRFNV